MTALIAYLPNPDRSEWFAHFARHFVADFVSSAFTCELAQAHSACPHTAFPTYTTHSGDDITIQAYTLALEIKETQEMVIFTSHYRPMDLFDSFGFDVGRLKALYTAHMNAHLPLEMERLVSKLNLSSTHLEHLLTHTHPWLFRTQSFDRLTPFEAAHDLNTTQPKAFFQGVMNRGRAVLNHLTDSAQMDIVCGSFQDRQHLPETDYFKKLLQYRMALSVPGAGDLCHRDIECLGLGMPILRPTITATLAHPIPRDAYIAVDFEASDEYQIDPELYKPWHPKNPKELAADLEKKLSEVMEDMAYLQQVAHRGHQHYLAHYRWPQPALHALKELQALIP